MWRLVPLLLTLVQASVRADERLTLEAYLAQVAEGHQGVRAARAISDGARLRSREARLLVAPQLFAQAQSISDARPSPFFPYDKIVTSGYSFGLSQQTTFGLQARLSYNFNYTDYVGLRPAFYEGRPALELTQSLWRNGFGSETRAQQEQSEAGALASHYGERFRARTLLIEAEQAYWRLALARRTYAVSRDALERARKAGDWASRRARLQLADESDALQSKAAVELRGLQLQAAEDEVRAAARAFNQARGAAAETVAETLEELADERVARLEPPVRAGSRDDVKAADQAARLARATADAGLARDLPTVDVFGTVALNSLETDASEARSKSLTTDRPTQAIGLRFSVPLNLPATFDSRAGWHREREGADLNYQRKLFEQEREWTDLTVALADAKRRLALARSMEAVQARKYEHERGRLQRGRSTLYQVLLFEEDYAQAQLVRLRTLADVLLVAARLKIFREGEFLP
jgi:outer membrane protein TolC